MRLYVPTNGDQLLLTADWAFTLHTERWHSNRSKTLYDRLGIGPVRTERGWHDYPTSQASLPAGTLLQVDRVYIRRFNRAAKSVEDDYDSITFQVTRHPTWPAEPRRKVLARFWVKLSDANNIEFEHASAPRWAASSVIAPTPDP